MYISTFLILIFIFLLFLYLFIIVIFFLNLFYDWSFILFRIEALEHVVCNCRVQNNVSYLIKYDSHFSFVWHEITGLFILFLYSWIVIVWHIFQHYASIMKYISQPPLLLDVHIHKPLLPARTWMDSLLAFFPGLQVKNQSGHFLSEFAMNIQNIRILLFAGFKGRYPASHRDAWNALSGYQETQLPSWGRSSFQLSVFWMSSRSVVYKLFLTALLPHVLSRQAFTTDFRVHWAQHPLRPEFAESTYFLYKVQLSSQTNLNTTSLLLSIMFLHINLQMWPHSRCIAPAEVHSTVYYHVANQRD